MRTTAQGRGAATSQRGAVGRRRSAAKTPASAPQSIAPPPSEPSPIAVTAVTLLRVEEGFYALRVGDIPGDAAAIGGMAVPAAQLSAPLAADGTHLEIVATHPGRGPWLDKTGGTAILRAPPGGGFVLVTAYGRAGQPAADVKLDLQRLDGPAAGLAEPAAPIAGPTIAGGPAALETRDIPTEIMLHIERAGDRLFPGRGWVGALGRRIRIEAFSVRPLQGLQPAEIEMKAFLPNGGETPWIPGGQLCGTRGRGLPLMGFAVRVVPQRADRFDVVYQGSFFAGGISEPCRNGEPCRAATADDPLEAVNLRLIERGTEPAAAPADRTATPPRAQQSPD